MPAPQHSVTAAIRVIASLDPAWDHSRIDAEYLALEKDGLGHTHPYMQYVIGATRFDLDAPVLWRDGSATPKSYLQADARPLTWLMRRLKVAELAQCEDLPTTTGRLKAFRLGLTGIENAPDGLTTLQFVPGHLLSEVALDAIVEAVGADPVFAAGAAVMRASSAPTPAEKKP